MCEVDDEDLAVSDLAGARRSGDGLDHGVDLRIGNRNLHLHLRQEADDVFGSAIDCAIGEFGDDAEELRGE